MSPQLKRALLHQATEPYRASGSFPYHWARGKLKRDPMFEALLDANPFPDGARVLDLGCGMGLLAAWLLAAEQMALQGKWSERVAPPMGLQFRGVDLAARDTDAGNRALQPRFGSRLALSCGDLRLAGFADSDVIAILDVLHYVPREDQDLLLDRIAREMPRPGLLAIRVGDADAGIRFQVSRLTDRLVASWRGHATAQMNFRPMHEWIDALAHRGFDVQSTPMSQGTPFANALLLARRRTSMPVTN
jgi:SAM-dependent methyltransferase